MLRTTLARASRQVNSHSKFYIFVRMSSSGKQPLAKLVPPSSWDSHMHITDPANFPVASTATYTPHAALLQDARANAEKLNLPNLVLVQPSTYGLDNSCLLYHLDILNKSQPDSARGVVVIDPDSSSSEAVSDAELLDWHNRGVRGVRINLKSVGRKLDQAQLQDLLGSYAKRLSAVGGGVSGWAVQIFLGLEDVPLLESFAAECLGSGERGEAGGIKLVIDHLGSPKQLSKPAREMSGFEALVKLLKNPAVWIKVSGYYRTKSSNGSGWSTAEEWEEVVKELLSVRGGEGLVFASDWPHTRFDNWDVQPWIRACADWAGEGKTRDMLFRDNARHLWDVDA